MVIKQHIIDKVQRLREERNMMQYCDAAKMTLSIKELTKRIITMVQYKIFDIDDICEQNTLPAHDLHLLIDNAKQDILAQVSIAIADQKAARMYTQRLFAFYSMEMDLRRARDDKTIQTPLDYPISDFYLLKSCDVFLNRKIVMTLASYASLYNAAVELYDQLGEVLDDMMDVAEDIDAINSNRFLISLVECGLQKTIQEYTTFVATGLNNLQKDKKMLLGIGLDVEMLQQSLNDLLIKDWSGVTSSKTNEMLFGSRK